MYNLESEEDCGCDNNYSEIINNSPLLNGHQENIFDPKSNNQNSPNSQNNPIVFNNPNRNNQQVQMPHNQQVQMPNNQQVQMPNNQQVQIPNNQQVQMPHNQVKQMPNNQQVQMPNNQQVQMPNNPINNVVLSNLVNNSSLNKKINNKLAKNNLVQSLKYIVILLVAFAWHDVGKFYINKAIKYKGGSETYYLYYAIILTLIIYFIVKYN